MSTTTDIDTALRVVVSPSQSSYFAGEPLQVTITITNTRSASESAPLPSLSAARHAHKRSAHSVSSAPLARPPTSPGLLRSTSSVAVPSSSKLVNGTGPKNIIERKGLVGLRGAPQGADQLPPEIRDGRKRMLGKSLSVDILPSQLGEQMRSDDAKGKAPQRLGESLSLHTSTNLTSLQQFPRPPASPPRSHARPILRPTPQSPQTILTRVNHPCSKYPPSPQPAHPPIPFPPPRNHHPSHNQPPPPPPHSPSL